MTPEYLCELADLADPEKLWRRAGLERLDFTPEMKRQLDAGVALRRHADHVRRVRELLGTGNSLVITPTAINGTATMTIPAPPAHKRLLAQHAVADSKTPNVELTGLSPGAQR